MNRIRLLRIDLSGATDVSGLESLRGSAAVEPVRKTLLLDVNAVPGLLPRLSGLDNFEGMAFGPPGRGGRRPLLLVSDDNFSARQPGHGVPGVHLG